MNYNKTLLILILLLSFTIIGEFYYIFFIQSAQSKSDTNQLTTIPVDTKTTATPSVLPTTPPNQAFNEGVFVSLRYLKKGMVSSSTMTYVLDGTIEKIDYLTEAEKRAINVTIKANNGDLSSFRFPDTEIVSVKDKEDQKIDLFSIKQNDTVSITVQFDMLKIDYKSIIIQLL